MLSCKRGERASIPGQAAAMRKEGIRMRTQLCSLVSFRVALLILVGWKYPVQVVLMPKPDQPSVALAGRAVVRNVRMRAEGPDGKNVDCQVTVARKER